MDPRLLKQIAIECNISIRTLQRRFAAQGVRFRDYRNQARVELAKQMLTEARLSMAEIATQLGYCSPSSFGRAFKRVTGYTPLKFVTSGPRG